MVEPKKMALLKLDCTTLITLLGLPANVEITGIQMDDLCRNGRVYVRIEGAGWETPPGHSIMPTTAIITTHIELTGAVRRTIDWHLPDVTPGAVL